ncbi:MAG TPA: prohibitin family protein [Leptolyngbyaceae cyanobacterium]
MNPIASLITCLVAVIVYLNSGKIPSDRTRSTVRTIAILVGVIAVISSITRLLVIVPAGNVGVVDTFGNVSDNTLSPGVHLVNPFTKVIKFSTRLKDVKENVDASSQEGLSLNLDVSLQYKLDPQKAAQVYKNIGFDETDLVISRFRSTTRALTAQYPASAIYSTKRQEIARQLDQQLSQQLPNLGFVVEETLLRNVKMPDELQAAIQEKLKAEQESQQMAFVLQKERQEAQRKLIEAKGIADSQKVISQGLNSNLLQLRAIEATEKLAQSPNSKIILVGSGQGGLPILLQPDMTTAKPK